VTGLLLAGVGHVTPAPNASKNFLVVDAKTGKDKIEAAFDDFINRKDIGILLINQHVSPFSLSPMCVCVCVVG
jgi:V-type H+-transporting ATPase subunit F